MRSPAGELSGSSAPRVKKSLITPDPREDPKGRSLKGVPIKYPLVVRVPN